MDWAMRRLGVHAFAKEPHVFHLLTNQTTRDANLFASHQNYLLAIQKLLRYDGSKPTQHVVACIDDHSLRTDS